MLTMPHSAAPDTDQSRMLDTIAIAHPLMRWALRSSISVNDVERVPGAVIVVMSSPRRWQPPGRRQPYPSPEVTRIHHPSVRGGVKEHSSGGVGPSDERGDGLE